MIEADASWFEDAIQAGPATALAILDGSDPRGLPLLKKLYAAGRTGAKNVDGRKRHIVVCSLGLLLAVAVTAANLHEGMQAPQVLGQLSEQTTSRLEKVYADKKYHCSGVWEWEKRPGVKDRVVVVKREGKEFKVLPSRWVVERTLAWLGRNRRLSKDYEANPRSSETWIYIAMIHRMARLLMTD